MTQFITLPLDPADLDSVRRAFRERYPKWSRTEALDSLRSADFARLDQENHTYLDFTGGGLFPDSLVRTQAEFLRGGVFGNPHSHNPASLNMTAHVEASRARLLEFFGASADEYVAIFTPNASGALKLVGESYPFGPQAHFALTSDNHNSVNGIREYAQAKGAKVSYVPLEPGELRLDHQALGQVLRDGEHRPPEGQQSKTSVAAKLFAYPAQSNFSGVKHDLGLVSQAQNQGWDVLLDAAAFAPTSPLDIGLIGPDFVALSFYKMFGYPTGIGALIAKREKLMNLVRPWFGGGTIQIASVAAFDHQLSEGEAGFEDGTVNYLAIPAVARGLDYLDAVGMETISDRVACLTGWFLEAIAGLRHSNGAPLATIHGPQDLLDRGGTITMTPSDPTGVPYSGAKIEALAAESRISVRTGCFCNPGAGEVAHGLSADVLLPWFDKRGQVSFQTLSRELRRTMGTEISAIRVSVGLISTFEDVFRAFKFFEALTDLSADQVGYDFAETHSRDSA